MKIRNSAKAVIVNDNKLLVTRLVDESGFFYLLPGGGQEPGEKLKQCLIRECREETGYEVEVQDLLFVRECFMDEGIHRVEFLFKAEILKETSATSMDNNQVGIDWLDLDSIVNEPLFPMELRKLLQSYKEGRQEKVYLGEIR